MSPNHCQDTYWVFMCLCVRTCAHTCNNTHSKIINIFAYSLGQPHSPCRCFQSLTAPRTGLSSSNKKHMCSTRRDLFQAHLLLAKHFHPHLNLSVSSLSAKLSLQHVRCIQCCMFVCWAVYNYDTYTMRMRGLFGIFRLPRFRTVSPLSSFLPFLISSCCKAGEYTLFFFKQWPDVNHGVNWWTRRIRCIDGLCVLNLKKGAQNIQQYKVAVMRWSNHFS